MIKFKDIFKRISENITGRVPDGEPDTGFLPKGRKRTLGANKGKPELWFDKGGYTQIDFPVADDIFGPGEKPDLAVSKRKTPEKDSLVTKQKKDGTELMERIKLKDILNEGASKIFSSSLTSKIENSIKRIAGISDIDYTEYRFSTGGGGFKWVWTQGRGMASGMASLSLNMATGKHNCTVKSYYGGMSYAVSSPIYGHEGKPVGKPVAGVNSWRDLNDTHLTALWKIWEKEIKKNEKAVSKWWDKESKAQMSSYTREPGRGGTGID